MKQFLPKNLPIVSRSLESQRQFQDRKHNRNKPLVIKEDDYLDKELEKIEQEESKLQMNHAVDQICLSTRDAS